MDSKVPSNNLVIEVCADSVESAIAAQRGGANRVELCAGLMEGGTTPSAGAIEMVRRKLNIALHVIIRPRAGDFLYSETDFEVMKMDIALAKRLGADGVAIGILTQEGGIDIERTKELLDMARPLGVTFHRAFDMSRDPVASLDDLIALGVDRVLTSGQEASVIEGLSVVSQLVRLAAGRIAVMAGGGLTQHNVKAIVSAGVRELHFTGRTNVESIMTYRNLRVSMSSGVRPAEYSHLVTDSERVRSMREEADANAQY
jgi:copper homeostasis protein